MRLFVLSFSLAVPVWGAVDFVRDVQPIFKERCHSCHGPNKQEAALRLDHKPSALKGGDFGLAIKVGHSAQSALVHAIEGRNPKMRMPRKGDPLTEQQISTIKAWIDDGAEWPDSASVKLEVKTDHWAFKAPVKVKVPSLKFKVSGAGSRTAPLETSNLKPETPINPIDVFVQDRLTKEGLNPAPKAAHETLVRRLYLDLIGLPPTPADLANSTNLPATIEKLLASQHHGERWGRYWLDAAHYADSNGYEKDPMRFIWFYRDWVINAFNRDLPYDQFIIEQIAGDLLPNATQDQIVATGFLRNTMINEEGGVNPEQFRMEAMFDRMDTIGKSVLGLTIGCTQCHNHKYDPISQEEYYRMFAFLNNDNEPWRVVYTASEQMQRSQILQRISELETKLKHEYANWEHRMAAWVKSLKPQPKWSVLRFVEDPSGGEKAIVQPDGSILAQGYAPTRSHVKFVVDLKQPTTLNSFRLELMNDPNLPAYGPGRSQIGTAALTEFTAEMKINGKMTPLKFIKATADFGEPENTPLAPFAKDKDADKDKRVTGPIAYAIDGNDKTAWGINAGPGRRNIPRNAVFVLEKPIQVKPEDELTVGLSMKHGGWNSDDLQTMNLGRYRISTSDASDAEADPLYGKKSEFTVYRDHVAEWKAINDEIESLWKQHPQGTTSLVLDAREQPRMTAVLKRGDFLKPAETVEAGVPAMLNPLPKNSDKTRLTFARWLVSREAPTTARAIVNRVWQSYFGTGLVETADDFGTQGAKPSHPELLDWLACEFMDHGWSLKHLHRLIVTSETYQQDSKVTTALLEKDPYNRLLARGPRFRVEGEIVRDIQLAVSGLLNPAIGGRGVMPPAPAHLFEKPASYAPFPWQVEADAQKYRRSVYVFRRRSTPYPFLATFDVPNGESACIKRARSNTPLQALMTLNETLSMEASQHLAQRMTEAAEGNDRAAIVHGFKLCTSRAPSGKEETLLLNLLQQQRQSAKADSIPPMVTLARVLLNLDETITKE